MAYENIIGNQDAKDVLITSLNKNNILHSYLFCGQEGIGKFLIAKEFAKSILCENKKDAPCNNCKSCIEFETNNNPDFYEVHPEGNTIKIDQIRYMNSKIIEKPVSSQRKVYIINDSDKMTKEAQNSLLKTLEEPPEYAVIILICNQENNILNTIKSRCTKIEFSRLTNEEIQEYFKKNGNDVSQQILNLAEGSISKALKRKPKQDVYLKLEKLIYNIENIDKLEMLKQEFIYQEKDDIQSLLEVANSILFRIAKEKMQYLNCIDIVENTKKNLSLNGNFDMCIDNLLLSIWEEVNEKHSGR